jgi:hypothetical protein
MRIFGFINLTSILYVVPPCISHSQRKMLVSDGNMVRLEQSSFIICRLNSFLVRLSFETSMVRVFAMKPYRVLKRLLLLNCMKFLGR